MHDGDKDDGRTTTAAIYIGDDVMVGVHDRSEGLCMLKKAGR